MSANARSGCSGDGMMRGLVTTRTNPVVTVSGMNSGALELSALFSQSRTSAWESDPSFTAWTRTLTSTQSIVALTCIECVAHRAIVIDVDSGSAEIPSRHGLLGSMDDGFSVHQQSERIFDERGHGAATHGGHHLCLLIEVIVENQGGLHQARLPYVRATQQYVR